MMDLGVIWRSERVWAWTIFVFLGIVGIATLIWFRSYHEIRVDDDGFHWNPRDGSVVESRGAGIDEGEEGGEGQQSTSQTAGPLPGQYVGWFQVAVLGTVMFLMSEVYLWYPKIGRDRKCSYIKLLPWYISNFFTGPIIALAILWMLTNISLNLGGEAGADGVTGVGIDFGALPTVVLLAIAWMLGFYSRTARKQLDQFMKQLLPAAWKEAHQWESQLIIDGPDTLTVNSESEFTTSLGQTANWSVVYLGNIKAIELWTDDNKPVLPVISDLQQMIFVGESFFLKVTVLTKETEAGRIIIRAEVCDLFEHLEITVPI